MLCLSVYSKRSDISCTDTPIDLTGSKLFDKETLMLFKP